jgi:hypothetical protein
MNKSLWIAGVIALILGILWFVFRPGLSDPASSDQQIILSQQQVQAIQDGVIAIQAIPEQVRKEVRQGVKAVVVRVDSYDTSARIVELERIIGIGRAIRAGGHDSDGD